MKLLSALKFHRFSFLFAGQTVSRIGDHLYQLALAWWVLEKTGSATDMGIVMICSFAPMLVFLLIGGAAVDRLPRVGIMIASDVLRALLMFVVAALALSGKLTVFEVLVATLLFGFVDAFFDPAATAVLPELVPDEHLNSANALTSLGTQLGRISGPPLGALLIGIGGTGYAFALNGTSFVISALCLLPLLLFKSPHASTSAPSPFNPELSDPAYSPLQGADAGPVTLVDQAAPSQTKSSIFRDVREGIQFVLSQPWLWITIVTFTAANMLLGGPFSVTLPFLIQKTRGWDVRELGLVYAMFPVGYAIAAVATGQLKKIPRRGFIMFASMAAAGAAIALFAFPVPLLVLFLAAFVNGFALELGGLAYTRLIQEKVPAGMLGRVSSIGSLGSFALLPVGFALAGWATDVLSPPWVFVIGGTATTLVALIGLTSKSIRSLS